MKKAAIISLIAALTMLAAGAVYAHWPRGHSMDYSTVPADVEILKKFQKETLSLRDELMTKKLELREEYSRHAPDAKRTAALKKEIIDLQAKIQEIAEKYKMQWPIRRGMMGRGMMGQGMTMGMCSCPCQ